VESADLLTRWASALVDAFSEGATLFVAGNGGSAALASHLSGELLGRYQGERRPLPGVWLGADQATLTAVGNDYGFANVFARQVIALARPGDVVLLLSTSGRSNNLLAAAAAAREVGCECWSMTGPAPNPLADVSDHVLTYQGSTPLVQEFQQIAVHLLCELIDAELSAVDAGAIVGADQAAAV
jgi:phosphoheptose isomerase